MIVLQYLFEPFQGIGGEVVPLRMSQDILGQRREDSLKIGTLGSGSHSEMMRGEGSGGGKELS